MHTGAAIVFVRLHHYPANVTESRTTARGRSTQSLPSECRRVKDHGQRPIYSNFTLLRTGPSPSVLLPLWSFWANIAKTDVATSRPELLDSEDSSDDACCCPSSSASLARQCTQATEDINKASKTGTATIFPPRSAKSLFGVFLNQVRDRRNGETLEQHGLLPQ